MQYAIGIALIAWGIWYLSTAFDLRWPKAVATSSDAVLWKKFFGRPYGPIANFIIGMVWLGIGVFLVFK
ncbi:hypothetical protein TH61_11040 [Rufibacter sp. DG15C]|nr:hypothetical protein TH61_11040 [Rufibacter sp. DG15C]